MAQAGYCSECKANVWLTTDGTCPAGHGAECISNVYEASSSPVAAAPMASPTPSATGLALGGVKQKKPFYKRVWFWAVVVIVVLIVGISESGSGSNTGASTAGPSSAATSSTVSQPAQQSAVSSQPTQKPTASQPSQASVVQDAINEVFGDFSTVKKSGRGDSVVKLPAGVGAALVSAKHTGSSNFAIETLDDSNQEQDLLVNTIGKYSGTTLLADTDQPPKSLRITADGSWTLKLSPVSHAPAMTASTSGRGDAVLIYKGAAADFAITNKGSSNFAVQAYSDGTSTGSDLLVNEIGNYKGTVPVSDGPLIIFIQSDGRWTIRVEQ